MRRLACLVVAAGLLTLPGVGRAAVVRTVCASSCDFTSVGAAVTASDPGDAIEVMPGTYTEQVSVNKRLTIFAPPDGPRPVIESGGSATFTVAPGGAGTSVSHLDIRGVGSTTSALIASGAVTATDLTLTATQMCAALNGTAPSQLGPGVTATASPAGGPCVTAGANAPDTVTGVTVNAPGTVGISLAEAGVLTDSTVNARVALIMGGGSVRRATLNGATFGVEAVSSPTTAMISDSVVTANASGGIAVLGESVGTTVVGPVKLRNVTAIAAGTGSIGLDAASQGGPAYTAGAIDARNVIARGVSEDVFGEPGGGSSCSGPCAPGEVTIGYSNFVEAGGFLDTTIGHNQSTDPLLVNPLVGAGQDFHLASAGSPAIGAGTADADNGPSDRDGIPHRSPPAIGAYEYTGPPAPPAGGGPPPGGPAKPAISQLTETNRVFAVARRSTPLRGRTAAERHRRGTIFSFALDQRATVRIAITTSPRCRRTTKGVRRTPRCARRVATLTRSAHAGVNRVPFSGRIRRKSLTPGPYRAAFTAASVGGTSPAKALRFRVVRR